MADTQAQNAQGQQGEQAPAAPDPKAGVGEQKEYVPLQRFNEVYGELKQTREESAQMRQQLAELQAKMQTAQDQPGADEEDPDPDKVVERNLQKLLAPYNQILVRMGDKLDAIEFRQVAAGLPPEEVKAAEALREKALKNGVSLSRRDSLAYGLGLKALEERERAAADEAARIRANAGVFIETRAGSPAPPEKDLDSLPPAERAEALAKRLGDQPI